MAKRKSISSKKRETGMTKSEQAHNFIKVVVKGYMISDLKRMMGLEPVPNAPGNCNFPIALFALSCMDFLGYLTTPQKLDSNGDTTERIKAYIDMTFKDEDKTKLAPHMNNLVNIFRHGLSHEFFPKMSGISRKCSDVFWLSQEGYLILDADRIAEMFERSIEKLEDLIKSETRAVIFVERYEEKQEYNQKFRVFPNPMFTSPTGLQSMATVSMENMSNIKKLE